MMYKKIITIGIFVSACILGIVGNLSYAQEYTEEDMNKVSIAFCTNGTGPMTEEPIFSIEPGKEQELCLYLQNAGQKKIEFDYGFTKGETTIHGTPICEGSANTGNVFAMLIPQTKDRIVSLDPMSTKVIYEKIIIPPGMSGLVYGCLTYKLRQPQFQLNGGMFLLEVRHSRAMRIMIGGESNVKSSIKLINLTGGVFSNNKQIRAEVDQENDLKLTFLVENEGNIQQKVTINGKIYNALGFQKDFAIMDQNISPGEKNEFVADVGILPVYKGFYTVKFDVINEPQFAFEVTDEKLKQPGNISIKAKIFVFSWIWIAVIIVVLRLIYKMFAPKKVKTTATTV